MTIDDLGPFDCVLDVGGNVGEFAEGARVTWPDAQVTSFEPVSELAAANRKRADGRWWVEPVALSDVHGQVQMAVCVNQHSASTIMRPGELRRRDFGIRDQFDHRNVPTRLLDNYQQLLDGKTRALLKIDVEGAEGKVLLGGRRVLADARLRCVLVEVNQAPDIFVGSPPVEWIDGMLREYGFGFAGVLATQVTPAGETVQFDGAWVRV